MESRGMTLVIAGVVSIALHALLLAHHQLLLSKRGSDRPTPLADNTKELWQSASQGKTSGSLDARVTPPSPVLPAPNPPDPLSLRRPKGAVRPDAPGQATPRSSRGRSSSGAMGVGQRRHPPQRLKGDGAEGSGSRDEDRARGGGSGQGEGPEDWDQAIQRLRGGVGQQRAAAGGRPNTLVVSPSDGSMPAEVYGRLWEKAQPWRGPIPRGAVEPGQMAVEVRQVPWRAVREAEVSIRHGQVALMPETVWMLWLAGDHLYLLRSSRPPEQSL